VGLDPSAPSFTQLEHAIAAGRRSLADVADLDQRHRRAAALDGLAEYVALLRKAMPEAAAPGRAAGPKPENRFAFKLEYPDGRWDVDETSLGTPPRVGDFVELGLRGRWQVLGIQLVRAAIAARVEREFFVCAPSGGAPAA
jgi:hypothetical protein